MAAIQGRTESKFCYASIMDSGKYVSFTFGK